MNRLLIADDEAVERNALRLMVSKDLSDFEVVGEAENGIETIERTRALRPDLVLLDIKMPGIDGLSAISEIRKFDEHVRFVVLSAHNDFEYAQTALKLGADDYLLKPARIHKLAETLQNVARKASLERVKNMQAVNMQSKIESLRPNLENRIVAWITSGTNTDEAVEQYVQFLDIKLFPCLALVVRFHRPFVSTPERLALLRSFEEKLRTVCPHLLSDFVYDMLVTFLPLEKKPQDGNLAGWMDELSRYVRNILHSQGVYHFAIGRSDVAHDYRQLHAAYLQAVKATRQSGPASETTQVATLDIYRKEQKLIEKIVLGDPDQSLSLLMELFEDYRLQCSQDMPALKAKVRDLVIVIKRKLVHEKCQHASLASLVETYLVQLERVVAPAELLSLTKTIVSQCAAFCQSDSGAANTLINSAVDYIGKNFTKSFSLDDIAHELGVSAPYLSRLFKLRLGKNFIDYITELRIEHAKSLLQNGQMSIKEITYTVGYNSQTYFCKVFKKVVGIPASQYSNSVEYES